MSITQERREQRRKTDSRLVHATCVAWKNRAALLTGPPGAGKSDLALRFLQTCGALVRPDGDAVLIGDDQVQLERDGNRLIAHTVASIAGKLEVRGLGIIEIPYRSKCAVTLIADLGPDAEIPRLPAKPLPTRDLLGLAIPVLTIAPFEASAAIKLRLALDPDFALN